MQPATREWLNQAKYSLQDAQALLRSGRYLFAAYACQLTIEKALKAVIVERTATTPPKIHNLTELAKIGQAPLTEEQTEFIAILNMAAIGTRYPETLNQAVKQYPKKVVSDPLLLFAPIGCIYFNGRAYARNGRNDPKTETFAVVPKYNSLEQARKVISFYKAAESENINRIFWAVGQSDAALQTAIKLELHSARWKEAEEFITKHGSIFKTPSGYIQRVPQVSIAQT